MANDGSRPAGNVDLGPAITGLSEGLKLFGNRFTLVKLIEHGPNSVVWLAWHEEKQCDVAMKFLPEPTQADPGAVALLKREVHKLQDINHPALVPILEVVEDGPLVAIVSEYVDGVTLADMRASKHNQVFAPADLSESINQLLTVLEQGHTEKGIAHGGINPYNLMVSQQGDFRVADYGLAGPVADYLAKTHAGPLGKRNLPYLSPQQAVGNPPTPLDDIYSIAATIYEMLTSRAMFYTGDIMKQVEHKIPPPMTHRRKELRVIGEPIPRLWEEAFGACLAKNPDQRPQSVGQLREMLGLAAAAASAEAAATAAAAHAAPVAAAPASGSNAKMIVGVVMGVVILGLVAVIALKKKPAPEPPPGPVATSPTQDAIQRAAKEAEDRVRREAEAKLKQAQEEAERLRKENEETSARLAKESKSNAENEARLKKERQDDEEERKKADLMVAERIRREASAKVSETEAERLKLQKERTTAATTEGKRLEEIEQARKEAEERAKAAAEERMKLEAQLAGGSTQKVNFAAIAMEKARVTMAAKRTADAAAKGATNAAVKRFETGAAWENSLGMKLVPVGKVMAAVWETRQSDFQVFVDEAKHGAGTKWKEPGFKAKPGVIDPVVNVSWADAQAFCKWLTEKERAAGLLPGGSYRLPTDAEWSELVKLEGETGGTPAERSAAVKEVYPWGKEWPMPAGVGNFAAAVSPDQFEQPAPVGTFRANVNGLYDLGGNVWEWCEDWSDASQKSRVLRGGSWSSATQADLLSSQRLGAAPDERRNDVGFRVVLDPAK